MSELDVGKGAGPSTPAENPYARSSFSTHRRMALRVAPRPSKGTGMGLSRGDRAALRRMRRGEAPPAVFWSLIAAMEVPESDAEEVYWIDVLPLMVTVPHVPGRWPGKSLRLKGLSAPRLERWLRHDGLRARQEARRLLSILRAEGFDWGPFGQLLSLWDHPELGERLKRRFARDYFLTRIPTGGGSTSSDGED